MSRWGCLAVTTLVVLGLVFMGSVGARIWGALQDSDEDDAARVVRCERGRPGLMVATIRVTNGESFRSDFNIHVAFEDDADGSRIETRIADVLDLDPGETTEVVARSRTEAPATGFACDITGVDQFTAS